MEIQSWRFLLSYVVEIQDIDFLAEKIQLRSLVFQDCFLIYFYEFLYFYTKYIIRQFKTDIWIKFTMILSPGTNVNVRLTNIYF